VAFSQAGTKTIAYDSALMCFGYQAENLRKLWFVHKTDL